MNIEIWPISRVVPYVRNSREIKIPIYEPKNEKPKIEDHHKINWNNTVPKIMRETYRKMSKCHA